MCSRLFMDWLQFIWLNLWNLTFYHVLWIPSQLHFSRYLPPERRPMVTVFRQECVTFMEQHTTPAQNCRLAIRFKSCLKTYLLFVNIEFDRLFWTFICICRLLLMILWYLPYLDPSTFLPLFSSPGHRPCELLSWVSVRPPLAFHI